MTISLTNLLGGVGMLCGTLVVILSILLHRVSTPGMQRRTSWIIGFMGLLVFAVSYVLWRWDF